MGLLLLHLHLNKIYLKNIRKSFLISIVPLHTGIGRNSSRIASRRIASTRDGNNYYSGSLTDDEDDVDWATDKKKKRLQSMRSNGSKKNGKSSNNN